MESVKVRGGKAATDVPESHSAAVGADQGDDMNINELAQLLNGREYRKEITKEEELAARLAGLVVVFGASDDLLEFRGAIDEEVGAYEGAHVLLTKTGIPVNECDDEHCPYFGRILEECESKIESRWCPREGLSWEIVSNIPSAKFTIMDDGEAYCEGLVFRMEDLK